ncbi:hypothetical protein EOT10_02195 [Streptomyces antnestii]|uniref:UL36 very large tegument protein n=1 Tax=Streptomyces antnestii TaxID=2494256 RepID=A0A437Q3M1_9ACTN|nr:hypothetical protein [Streptomyces sp. San01]RVU29132.1 hypothetical protein EOT10_02195 [Streptomyces sp. San01]
MDGQQLPDEVREFAVYLRDLLARLDQAAGWCGVFWQRDPDGMRACLAGGEVPPWDVVEAVLQDLAVDHGPDEADREYVRARALHRASQVAYDALPGVRDLLGDRLDVMLREQRHAAGRTAELARLLPAATNPEQADGMRLDLAWARDDHARATARCAELRGRMADLDRAARSAPPEPSAPATTSTPSTQSTSSRPAKERKRRPRGSARFAGMPDVTEAADVPEPADATDVTDVTGRGENAVPAPGATPRGARFAGAVATRAHPSAQRLAPAAPDHDADRATAACVSALLRLRGEGRGGEAHGVLVEAARWPAARFPLLAAELHRAGLGADWATLLWETASLPADLLVAAADALGAAGRTADARQILRQGVARPAAEIGEAVLRLGAQGRSRETRALLDAYVRVRTPEEAARSVRGDPDRLVPLLVDAARGVSDERYWDVVHALRVAGFHT